MISCCRQGRHYRRGLDSVPCQRFVPKFRSSGRCRSHSHLPHPPRCAVPCQVRAHRRQAVSSEGAESLVHQEFSRPRRSWLDAWRALSRSLQRDRGELVEDLHEASARGVGDPIMRPTIRWPCSEKQMVAGTVHSVRRSQLTSHDFHLQAFSKRKFMGKELKD